MANLKRNVYCDSCCNTGILRAKLMRNEEGDKYIEAVICGGHFSNEAAEKNLIAMNATTGLSVDILSVEQPKGE